MRIKKIVSGGQSGVDIGALDFSIENKYRAMGGAPKEDAMKMDLYPTIIL